jgi:hypothetical protein
VLDKSTYVKIDKVFLCQSGAALRSARLGGETTAGCGSYRR